VKREAEVPLPQVAALDDAVAAIVATLRDGGYSDLAISTIVVRHVAHVLGSIGDDGPGRVIR